MRSLFRSFRSGFLPVAGLLGLAGFPVPLPAQLPLEPAAIDHRATIIGRRVGIDSVTFLVEQEASSRLRLVVDYLPGKAPDPYWVVPNHPMQNTIHLRVENRGAVPLRIPLWVFLDPQVDVVRRGQQLTGWSDIARVTTPVPGQTWPRWKSILDIAPPEVALLNQARRIELPGGMLGRLERGDRSPPLIFGVGSGPDFDEFRIAVTVRALPAAPPVPATAPATIPRAVREGAPVVQAGPAPRPFAAGLLSIRFHPEAPSAARQVIVERLGGRVVGGMPAVGEGGEGDYVIALAGSPSADRTLAAVRLARQWGGAHLLRAGLVFAGPQPAPEDLPPLREIPEPHPRTLLLTIKFAPDATSAEIANALAMIGATPIGIGRDAIRERLDAELRDAAPSPTIHPLVRTHVVRLTDSTEQGYQRAVSQLETIAATGIWGAWIGGREWAMEDVRVCAGYCGPPPSDLGTAPLDPAIRAFVDSLDLPGTPAIQDLVSLPELDFLAFTVYYGAPMEVYATVTALRHRGKVGLLRPASWQRAESASNPLIALTDTILRSTALLDTLEQGYVSFYSGTYLPALIRSPIVNRAVMRRVVAHCYDARYFCDLQPVVEVAARNHDIVTLTELGFLSLGGTLYANKALEPRLALRDLANEILPDSSPDPATLFLIALALIDEPDSVLARRLVAHPKARSDIAVLTVLAYRYPGVDSIVLERLPVATRPVLGRLLMASLTYSRHQELRRLLSDPVLGEDRVVLTVVANLGQWVPRVFTAAAARKLPDEVIRRWDDYPVPPVLPER